MERWATIEGFENYEVSDHGHIRRVDSDRILAQSVNQSGLYCIGLFRDGRQWHRSVPQLVARAFIKNNKPAFDTPINLDGNRGNNHVDNLMWRPLWFAVKYNQQFRNPYEYPIVYPIVDVKTGEMYRNSFDCAVRNGLLEKDVVLSITNNTVVWTTYQKFEVVE